MWTRHYASAVLNSLENQVTGYRYGIIIIIIRTPIYFNVSAVQSACDRYEGGAKNTVVVQFSRSMSECGVSTEIADFRGV